MNFLKYLKTRPVALVSFVFLILLYIIMIFCEFVSPYTPTRSFSNMSFHPCNIEVKKGRLVAREYRVINPINLRQAKLKGVYHDIQFFVKGEGYKLLGFIPCSRHLFGISAKDSSDYPVFLLGADNLGRDLFSRIVYGSRISLTIGFVACGISLFLAILLGGVAGFFAGVADWSLMRLAEFFMLIPALYLILFLRSLMSSTMDSGQAYMSITLILSLVGWPGAARTVRGLVHSIKAQEFVLNAMQENVPSLVIIFRHIIPQMASLLIVSAALSIPGFIMSETTLSYLGLGIADPAVSWGSLINKDISTLSNLRNFPWLLTPIWLLLCVTLAFNFISDSMRDFFDPYHAIFVKHESFSFSQLKNILARLSLKSFLKTHSLSASIEEESRQNTIKKQATNSFLCVKNLKVNFSVLRANSWQEIQAVRGVSFCMERGEVLGIVGESGSGKSVTCMSIMRLLPKNATVSGSIYFRNEELLSKGDKDIRLLRGKKIAYIFQEPGQSFDSLQNIRSVFFETLKNSFPNMTKIEMENRTIELLQQVGIPNAQARLVSFPHQFSGGQLQRISIALALAQNPELLIADEATTALDVTVQSQIVALLLKLKKELGLSIIFISHNIHLVSSIADRILVMYGGSLMEIVASQDINTCTNPYTQALIAALPRFGMHYSKDRLHSIPGNVMDNAHPVTGCAFYPRCSFVKDSCKQEGFKCYKMNLAQNQAEHI